MANENMIKWIIQHLKKNIDFYAAPFLPVSDQRHREFLAWHEKNKEINFDFFTKLNKEILYEGKDKILRDNKKRQSFKKAIVDLLDGNELEMKKFLQEYVNSSMVGILSDPSQDVLIEKWREDHPIPSEEKNADIHPPASIYFERLKDSIRRYSAFRQDLNLPDKKNTVSDEENITAIQKLLEAVKKFPPEQQIAIFTRGEGGTATLLEEALLTKIPAVINSVLDLMISLRKNLNENNQEEASARNKINEVFDNAFKILHSKNIKNIPEIFNYALPLIVLQPEETQLALFRTIETRRDDTRTVVEYCIATNSPAVPALLGAIKNLPPENQFDILMNADTRLKEEKRDPNGNLLSSATSLLPGHKGIRAPDAFMALFHLIQDWPDDQISKIFQQEKRQRTFNILQHAAVFCPGALPGLFNLIERLDQKTQDALLQPLTKSFVYSAYISTDSPTRDFILKSADKNTLQGISLLFKKTLPDEDKIKLLTSMNEKKETLFMRTIKYNPAAALALIETITDNRQIEVFLPQDINNRNILMDAIAGDEKPETVPHLLKIIQKWGHKEQIDFLKNQKNTLSILADKHPESAGVLLDIIKEWSSEAQCDFLKNQREDTLSILADKHPESVGVLVSIIGKNSLATVKDIFQYDQALYRAYDDEKSEVMPDLLRLIEFVSVEKQVSLLASVNFLNKVGEITTNNPEHLDSILKIVSRWSPDQKAEIFKNNRLFTSMQKNPRIVPRLLSVLKTCDPAVKKNAVFTPYPRELLSLASQQEDKFIFYGLLGIIGDLDAVTIKDFQNCIRNTPELESFVKNDKVANVYLVLQNIKIKAADLGARKKPDAEAEKVATTLHEKLKPEFDKYIHDPSENKKNMLIKTWESEVESSRKPLEKHRGWKEFLSILVAVVTVIPALVILGKRTYDHAKYEKPFFRPLTKTDSINKAEAIGKQIKKL